MMSRLMGNAPAPAWANEWRTTHSGFCSLCTACLQWRWHKESPCQGRWVHLASVVGETSELGVWEILILNHSLPICFIKNYVWLTAKCFRWTNINTYQPFVPGINDCIKHRLVEEAVAHPLGYDDVHWFHGQIHLLHLPLDDGHNWRQNKSYIYSLTHI